MKYFGNISCASIWISVLSGWEPNTNRGIEVNPDQIEVVKCLKLSSNPKEVQVLTGMLAALNRFIFKFADHYRPFYQLLKKWKGF